MDDGTTQMRPADAVNESCCTKNLDASAGWPERILESDAVGYWDWNIPEHTEYMSPRFKSMLGYQEHQVENTSDARRELLHHEDLPGDIENHTAHVASNGEGPYEHELRYRHKDGSIIWILRRGQIVEWDETGDPVRMVGTHIDITALKKREAELRARANELHQFAFVAAHDLVQPINTIEHALSILVQDLPEDIDTDRKTALEYLNSATARMRARIGGILDYARLQETTLELETVDISQIVKTATDDLRVQIQESNATIMTGDLPVVSGAPSLLSQVVQNLISNAIKYRRNNRPCEVRVVSAPAPRGMVAFAVVDNGIGIAEEHRGRVFDLFARLHSDQKYAGNGIGLSLCERIVSQHGGSIEISDGDSGGCAFTVTLKKS